VATGVAPAFAAPRAAAIALHDIADVEREWNADERATIARYLEHRLGPGGAEPCARTADGMVHLDFAVHGLRYEGRPVAIELLDEEHVAANTKQALGRWLVRHKLLALYRFHVVPLSLELWAAAPSRDAYLDTLLEGCAPAFQEHDLGI
jgi:hypothetical protein